MSSSFGWRYYIREFLRSKSGIIGLGMLIFLVLLSVYASIAISQSTYKAWFNPIEWVNNPPDSPPSWVNYFNGFSSPTGNSENVTLSEGPSSPSFSVYQGTYSFTYGYAVPPSDIIFIPYFNSSALSMEITWKEPNGASLQFAVSQPPAGTGFDVNSQALQAVLSQYYHQETGRYVNSIPQVTAMDILFGESVNNGSSAKGTYTIQYTLLLSHPVPKGTSVVVETKMVGDSYGLMGTDYEGRPIALGILLGLPNAIEIGVITSIASVIPGVIYGGVSGYLGGRKDGVLQWVMLVFLAIPALPFLVVMSYVLSSGLSLLEEALLIAFLSWPFYAIIARASALSIKNMTFVEADRVLGIPSYRTFSSHFFPRLIPLTVAYTALGVPGGILLAETLAFLGIEPGNIVTWGNILQSAESHQAALFGYWWWIFFPGIMIFVASFPFVLVGFAMERAVAPKVAVK